VGKRRKKGSRASAKSSKKASTATKAPDKISSTKDASDRSQRGDGARALSPGERIFKIIENPFVQTPISILGGIIGFFVYGPVVVLCSFSILAGVHRSRALADLPRGIKLVSWSLISVLCIVILLTVGAIIDKHRDHIPTPKEISTAVINGLPNKKKPPHVEVDDPIPYGDPLAYILVPETNTGEETAMHKVTRGAVFFKPLGFKSENEVFATLYAQRDDMEGIPRSDQEPGYQHQQKADLLYAPSTSEIDELKRGAKVAYIALIVTYFDASGRKYYTERCVIYSPGHPLFGTCNGHNKTG
jgi:hypothetical protein